MNGNSRYNLGLNDEEYWKSVGLNAPASSAISNSPSVPIVEEVSLASPPPLSVEIPQQAKITPSATPMLEDKSTPNRDISGLLAQYSDISPKFQYSDALSKAQEEQRRNLYNLALLNAANQISSSIARGSGAVVEPTNLSSLERIAGQKVKDIKEARKDRENQIKEFYNQEAYQREINKNNPESVESKNVREIAMKALPEYSSVIAGKSARDIEEQLALFSKLKAGNKDTGLNPYQEARMEYLKDRLEESRKSRELSKERLGWMQKEKDELSDKQVEGLSELSASMDALDNLASLKTAVDTGPLSEAQLTLATALGIQDPSKAAFKASAIDALAQRIKALSGAAVSDQERAFLMQTLPNMKDSDAAFMSKLNEARKRIKMGYDRKVNSYTKQGKDASSFEEMTPLPQLSSSSEGPYGDIVKRNGKQYKWNPSVKKYQKYKGE